MEQLIFVYGTLMRGQRAHHMLSGARFCGQYTLHGYAMYHLGRYPGIRPLPGGQVLGEVYQISGDMLAQMDEYEEEGTLYHRKRVSVEHDSGQTDVWAYIYASELSGTPMTGRWDSSPTE